MTNIGKVRELLFNIRNTERRMGIALCNMVALRNYMAQILRIKHQMDIAQGEPAFLHITQLKLFILDGIHGVFRLYVLEKDRCVDSLKRELYSISYYDWSSVMEIWDDLDFIDEMNAILDELHLDSYL